MLLPRLAGLCPRLPCRGSRLPERPPAVRSRLTTLVLLCSLIILAWAVPAAQAQEDCSLRGAEKPIMVGDTLRLSLACPGPLPGPISWEFGDGTPATDFSSSPDAFHAYAGPGLFTLFARFKGMDIPVTAVATVFHRPTPSPPTHSATLVFDATRRRIWVVNPDNNSVAALDPAKGARILEVPAGRNPRTLALDPEGDIWVTSQDAAALHILDGQTGAEKWVVRLPFASRPFGIAFDPAGRNAYATLEATGRLVRIDPATRQITGSLDLGPTPRGIAVSHDGKRILVTRHISRMTRPGAADFGEVWEVDGGSFTLKRIFRLEADTAADRKDNGRGIPNGLSSITISPDGRMAWVPGTKANTQKGLALDGTRPTFETSVRTLVAGIDLVENREDMSTRKDMDNRSMASSLVFDRLGRFAYLTMQGVSRTAILQGSSLKEFSTLPLPAHPAGALLKGEAHEVAPIGGVLDDRDSLLFVHYFLSREVGVYDITKAGTGDTIPRLALIRTVEKEALPPQVLVGKQIFHLASDPRMSKEGYINCAVCHIDGSTDGRVWDFTDRGEGLRRTTSLLGRAGMGHGPVHWSANFDEIQDFEHDMRGPFGGQGFLPDADFNQGTRNQALGDGKAGLSPELDALAAYVSSLSKVHDSPYRNPDGTMTGDALKGRAVFNREDVGCARCHGGPRFTDSRLPAAGTPLVPAGPGSHPGDFLTAEGFLLHDVGTLKPASGKRLADSLRGLDTPTLKGVWEAGPYFHDGSAATLKEVLDLPGDRHGKTSHLTQEERDQLIAYLLQLDDLDENGNGNTGIRKPAVPGSSPGPSLKAHATRSLVRIDLQIPGGNGSLVLLDARGKVVQSFTGPSGLTRWNWIWKGETRLGRPAGPGIYFLKSECLPSGRSLSTRFLYQGSK